MKWILSSVMLAIIILVSPLQWDIHAQETQKSAGEGLTGAWQGSLKVPGGSLRVVFNFTAKEGGGYAVTLDSPDQGAKGIPCDSVVVVETSVHIAAPAIGGTFNGKREARADSIAGVWKQGGMEFPLVLKYAGVEVAAPKHTQEPKRPYPYSEEEVRYANPDASDTLSATLTLPSGDGPFPAVLLITGSGPQDRDETVFGHHPFLVLADHLTRHGIAVLRADDRGVGKSTGSFAGATSRDFAGDARAGIAFLKTRREIRHDWIGLIGHSEGGIIAPMVAADSKDVAFIVMMAGTGVPGDEVILKQAELIARGMGASEEMVSKAHELNRKVYALVESGRDSLSVVSEVRALLRQGMSAPDSASKTDEKAVNAAVDGQVRQVMSPWFRFFLTYDPRPALKRVHCPVLALNGEKDLQVPPDQNLPAIESALRAGGNTNVTIRKLPGLNHLFQTAVKGTPDEYATIEETISPMVLKTITDWILERCK